MDHILPLAKTLDAGWLAGDGTGAAIAIATLGADSGDVILNRDRTLIVLGGALRVTTGGVGHDVEAHALAFLPAGTPHRLAPQGAACTLLEIRGPQDEGSPPLCEADPVRRLRPENFTKSGFAYQSLIDREGGSRHLRVNIVDVQPGSGSPDYHIHDFDQFYFILSGEMQVEIGHRRQVAAAGSFVHLPAGLVHRNYNAGPGVERHLTLIIPEPQTGAIFDYACTIHQHEAEIMEQAPI